MTNQKSCGIINTSKREREVQSMYGITIIDGINQNIFIVEGCEAAYQKFEGLMELFPYDHVYLWDYKTAEVVADSKEVVF